ncbi:MAG: hypothetical protein AAF235_05310, partial [Planctomycetota bacterium]
MRMQQPSNTEDRTENRNGARSSACSSGHPGACRGGWTQTALVIILAIAVLGSTLALAYRGTPNYTFFDPVIDVKAMIDRYAVEPPADDVMQQAVIDAMLETLDDPYAVFVPAERNNDFSQSLTGEYVGIGAEVTTRDDVLVIVTPL